MAVGTLKETSGIAPPTGPNLVSNGSARVTDFVTCHDDLKAAAETTNLLQPLAATSSNIHAVKVPAGATRVMFRAKRLQAATVTQQPIIYAFGIKGEINSASWFADTDATETQRIDRHGTGAGVTVTMSATLDHRDATYRYSPPAIHTDDGTPWFDCRGCDYVVALPSQAYNGDAAASTVVLECAFLS